MGELTVERTEWEESGSADGPLDMRRTMARESFGFLLAVAAHRFRASFEVALEPLGLQVKHVAVLGTLACFGPVPQQQLGTSVCIDRTSMVALIDEMQERGLLRREPDPNDRRAYRIHLTAEGNDLLGRANALTKDVEDSCFGPLSADDRARLKRMLQEVVDVGALSGFEHINIRVKGRGGEAPGRADANGTEGGRR